MHSVLFNLCLPRIAAVRGELCWTLFDSGTNGYFLDERGPRNGKRAKNCLLKYCWLLASSAEKKTIVLHIHYKMSCQIAVVLWKISFLSFRGWRPGFQFRILWCCYCFICRAVSDLMFRGMLYRWINVVYLLLKLSFEFSSSAPQTRNKY